MAAAKRGSPLDRRRACGDFVDMDPLALDPYSFQMSPPPPRHDPVPGADFETLCAHFGEDRMAQRGAVAVPIYQASTFMFPDSAAWEQREAPDSPYYEYTRVGNPTTAVLEAKIARLEHGNWALALGSGMGAIAAAINACVHAGAHVVASGTIYWPTRRYLRDYLPRFGVETTFVDSCDPADFEAAIRPNTRLMYLESPTSGLFEMPDVAPIAAAARARGVVTVFDNSWATPCFQTPLDLGCDLVVHSATKFIGGHSDVVAGLVAGREDTLRRRVFRELELLGSVCDPFAAWLLIRGLRTLKVRMEQHQRSGLALARFLEQHPAVRRVYHPGLESHPQYAIGRRQLRGYSGLFSFELHDQSREATNRFMDRTRLFTIGVSWGGYESLVIGGTFISKDPQQPAWIIRLHTGLEATEDLIADVKQALES
ncbi:MAG: PLP-dependent transferase [Phycisphaerae bacterium]|jgi:cystathionine beta-lyase|nr:PLP-dependent transferase [Phycisphaerae bacterium]HOO15623.1 PLP-dependent aspartate aminotransferase family protein [Phycisphaerae bacterium]HPC21476.1 PLP-dependent aspartate aminotransferase family protein [Phycisphaerae bacterium]HRS28340.1 PLP-dependent aspartate aminotransferase family protein [Phycisphaerae bacterium]HRT41828.1 PLP-dependent aspartate aminotransferase family protein [Phycisphaerae bacterium]